MRGEDHPKSQEELRSATATHQDDSNTISGPTEGRIMAPHQADQEGHQGDHQEDHQRDHQVTKAVVRDLSRTTMNPIVKSGRTEDQ